MALPSTDQGAEANVAASGWRFPEAATFASAPWSVDGRAMVLPLRIILRYGNPGALLVRNDGKQKVGGAASSRVEHVGSGVVVRAVMRVRKAAHAVARLDVEPDAMAFPEDHAGRPDLHVYANHFVGLQPLAILMRVVGAIGQGERRVELAVRRAQPALGDRDGLALLAQLENVFAARSDVAQRRENVHVFGGAGDPQHQHDRPGHFGVGT